MKRRGRGKTRGSRNDSETERKTIEQGYIPPQFEAYYREQLVPEALTEEQFEQMIETLKKSLPHVFRLRHGPSFEKLKSDLNHWIEELKKNNLDGREVTELDDVFGVIYKLTIDKPTLRKDPVAKPFHEWLTNNSDLQTIVRQELVSMIPPFFLDLEPGHFVLDCCASPGSKTSQIIDKISPGEGLLVANDVNVNRCHTLVHALNRYDMRKCIVVSHPAQYLPDIGKFDRILCDVPCSGDGTMRKNPDAVLKWSSENSASLHSLQLAILLRALQLLKVGGTLVYSTCSLNPLEDEAVINAAVLMLEGSVEIVDCSDRMPRLIRSSGLTNWKVITDDLSEVKMTDKNKTMFCSPQAPNLKNCMRFLPHQNDTGGFFVTVLRKNAERDVELPRLAHKPLALWREPPFKPLKDISPEAVAAIKEDYGLPDDFNDDLLFVHDDSCVNNIYILNDHVLEITRRIPNGQLRPVACGNRIFAWKTLPNEPGAVHAIPCLEGMDIVSEIATKRKISVTREDVIKLINAGNGGVHVTELSIDQSIVNERPGGLIFCVEGTDFAYGGLRLKNKIVIYVKNQFVKMELAKLSQSH